MVTHTHMAERRATPSLWPRVLSVAGMCLLASCEPNAAAPSAEGDAADHATLRLALGGGPVADVTGFLATLACGEVLQGAWVPLLDSGLPPHIDPDLAGASFGDWFVIATPGACTVSVSPMTSPGVPSAECLPAGADVILVAGVTTEITLVVQCPGTPQTGLDLVTVVNEAPVITDLLLHPADVVAPCTPVTLTVVAEDADGDPLETTFAVSGPAADAKVSIKANVVSVITGTAGVWTIESTVSDGYLSAVALAQFTVEKSADCP